LARIEVATGGASEATGTWGWSAPEQEALEPRWIDRRSDLYALSTTLAFVLSGAAVFSRGVRAVREQLTEDRLAGASAGATRQTALAGAGPRGGGLTPDDVASRSSSGSVPGDRAGEPTSRDGGGCVGAAATEISVGGGRRAVAELDVRLLRGAGHARTAISPPAALRERSAVPEI
jgi:hypothetical protein